MLRWGTDLIPIANMSKHIVTYMAFLVQLTFIDTADTIIKSLMNTEHLTTILRIILHR